GRRGGDGPDRPDGDADAVVLPWGRGGCIFPDMPRPRDRVLQNLEAIYRDAYERAKAAGDQARMADLDAAYQREQLLLEVLLDIRDALTAGTAPRGDQAAGWSCPASRTVTPISSTAGSSSRPWTCATRRPPRSSSVAFRRTPGPSNQVSGLWAATGITPSGRGSGCHSTSGSTR